MVCYPILDRVRDMSNVAPLQPHSQLYADAPLHRAVEYGTFLKGPALRVPMLGTSLTSRPLNPKSRYELQAQSFVPSVARARRVYLESLACRQ